MKKGTLDAPELATLHRSLDGIVRLDDAERFQAGFLQLAVALVNAAGGVLISREGGMRIDAELLSRQALSWSADLRSELLAAAGQAVNTNSVLVQPLERQSDAKLLVFPWKISLHTGCLVLVMIPEETQLDALLLYGQLLAGFMAQRKKVPLQKGQSLDTGLIQRFTRLLAESDRDTALLRFTSLLRQMAGCDRVAVAVVGADGHTRLEALSDITKVDQRTSEARLFTRTLAECQIQDGIVIYPSSSKLNSSPVLKEAAEGLQMKRFLALPLSIEGLKVGVLLFCWKDSKGNIRVIQRLQLLQPILAAVLKGLCQQPTTRERILRWPTKKKPSRPVLVSIVLLLALFPLPFKLKAPCVVVPTTTRYIAPRYDGILLEVLVQPGDMVNAGTILARLDGRELALEEARITAERDKSRKLHDRYMGSGDAAQTQLARLDIQRYDEQLQLLKNKQEQLILTSPVDGMLLSGDNLRREGGPVSRGETLFEVAPIERMRAELALPEKDVSFISPGMSTKLRFDSYAERSWKGELLRIIPRSQLRGNRNVFIATVEFDNDKGELRPGMSGKAHVKVGYRPLIWQLLRKPWYTLLSLLDRLF
ncbi:MAG: hypothetical protein CSB23_05340 [Deltaproteobacteria bacterium]|nr:MAG: hypothetical protein CSB23_05340 [Deltaproteobacteria bacterium]